VTSSDHDTRSAESGAAAPAAVLERRGPVAVITLNRPHAMSGTGVSSRERLTGLLADLDAERAELRALVAELDPPRWRTATPSPGWCVRDQVAHLAFFDGVAALAVAAPERFRAEERAPALADVAAYERNHLGRSPAEGAVLLAAWAGAGSAARRRTSA
jgi:hypothetical protein